MRYGGEQRDQKYWRAQGGQGEVGADPLVFASTPGPVQPGQGGGGGGDAFAQFRGAEHLGLGAPAQDPTLDLGQGAQLSREILPKGIFHFRLTLLDLSVIIRAL